MTRISQWKRSLLTLRMSSRLWISGESPPCTQRNCWFMRAANGRQSNASMHASYTLSEYFILPGKAKRKGTRPSKTWHQCEWSVATLCYVTILFSMFVLKTRLDTLDCFVRSFFLPLFFFFFYHHPVLRLVYSRFLTRWRYTPRVDK